MCYGPEIESVFKTIRSNSSITIPELRKKYQYREEGDITSLLEAAVVFLADLKFVEVVEGKIRALEPRWDSLKVLQNLRQIGRVTDEASPDFVFANLYEQLFVTPNQMFLDDLHRQVNLKFPKTAIGKEKVNAWKRVMEFLGLGYRVYSGFYALPQRRLLEQLVATGGPWEGAVMEYCKSQIDPFLPCMTQDRVFDGVQFGLAFLHKTGKIRLSMKQDLPYRSFGEKEQWNWIEVRRDSDVTLSDK